MPPGKALLILKPSYIGDAVLALPLLDVLLESYDDVAVCAARWLRPVFRGRKCEWMDPPPRSNIEQLRWARMVKRCGFAAAYLANRSFRAALLVRLSGVPNRIGHASEGRSKLLTHPVSQDRTIFESDCLLSLADHLGVARRGVLPFLPAREPCDGIVRIQPAARHVWKRPPWERVARATRSAGLGSTEVELIGGPAESEACRQYASLHAPGVPIWIGSLDLEPVLARLSASRAFIAGDTGLVHLAAALGVPTMAFLSPRLAPRWGWKTERNLTLHPDASLEIVEDSLKGILELSQW